MRGNVYSLALTAAAPTAYTGAAAGTPMFALFNPAGSNKALVGLALLTSLTNVQVTTTTAATAVEAYVGTPAVLGTGTTTAPTNVLTGRQTGSVANGFVNTALTSQTWGVGPTLTLAGLTTLGGVSNATVQVGAILPQSFVDLAGLFVVVPDNLGAIGCRTVPTSLNVEATLIWEEVPFP